MGPKYHSLNELIDLIEEPNDSLCRKVLDENYELFSKARGSGYNHQAWEGGYLDHLTEIMNLAIILYEPLNCCRTLPFSLSDALLVLYLHDLEKPWRYLINDKREAVINPELKNKRTQVKDFVIKKIEEYGFNLTPEHWNGIWYAEGEHNDYSSKRRTKLPLAAFVHMCDTWSARGWYNYPSAENDLWGKRNLQ